MKNFVKDNDTITVTAAADTQSDTYVVMGALRGVCQNTVLAGDDMVLVPEGIFDLPKATGEVWAIGDLVYWDATNGVMTKTATANILAGCAYLAALSADTTGRVYLDDTVR